MIKKVLIILIILIVLKKVHANEVELTLGSVSMHTTVDPSNVRLSNRITNDGRFVFNPLYGVGYTINRETLYYSFKAFTGLNCVADHIYGGTASLGYSWQHIRLGGIIGGYIQDDTAFTARNIEPFSIIGNRNALVPIIGAELIFMFKVTDTSFIKVNNLISPILMNTSIGYGVRY